ncbi:ABC transporter permease [Aeromicrobium alkaliterrae]|uniref:ABC transmembrane type-1 domain-containing protein n=1 Tax=Aeromicrobium alkaliterrae TaxID=302168 RepID=A0ABN2JX71_9ACTN
MAAVIPERARPFLIGGGGLVALVGVWWIAAATVLSEKEIPTPAGVVAEFGDTGFDFYRANFTGTIEEAFLGFLWGNGLALVVASVVLLVPFMEKVIMQVAVISYCLPLVALVPLLYVVLGPPEPGDPSPTAVVIAAISVFFTTVVGAVLGFRSADRTSLDVVSVYGGGRWQQMRRVQVVAALPSIISSLQIAAPTAFLGAILGEYIGGLDRGVAPALINSAQNLNAERAWSIMFACAAVAGLGYALFGLLGRLVAPWATGKVV